MNKDKFISDMAKTGDVTTKEFVIFLLEFYLLQDKSLNNYYQDLCDRYNQNYAEACTESAIEAIKIFIEEISQ